MSYETKCRTKTHIKIDEICQHGCDYQEARLRDKVQCEIATGCKYGEPFFIYKGITLIADGSEEPVVMLKFPDGSMVECDSVQLEVFISGFHQAKKWCEKGYAPKKYS